MGPADDRHGGFGDDPDLAAYRDNILFRQTGRRYAAAWHHLKPWYFFLVEVIPWAWLPLLFALPWAVPAWARRLRRRDPRIVLPLAGVVLILLFFSLSPGKRGVYILPTVPLLVLRPLEPTMSVKTTEISFRSSSAGAAVVAVGSGVPQ